MSNYIPTDPIEATHYIDGALPVIIYKSGNQYYQYSTLRKKFIVTYGINDKLLKPLDMSTESESAVYQYVVTLSDGTKIEQDLKADLPNTETLQRVG